VIPYNELSQPAAGQLMEYLRLEITRALSERRPLEEKWLQWQRLYKALPERQVKEFPFYGAANLVLPVIATDVDTIYSRIMGILFEPDNLWSCSPLRPDATAYAPRLQEFLAWAQIHELKAYDAVADFVLEVCKLGTGVLKQRFRRSMEEVYEFRETPYGTTERFNNILVNDNPVLEHVSLYDFLVPSAATSDQETWPWCAERVMLNWGQLQERVKAGIYQGTDRLASWNAQDKGSWITQELQRMDRFAPGLATQYELWEVWTKFDIRGNGRPVSVVCTVHLPTMTYLRIDYNPFFHQEFPYSVARYLRQEKRFYGIGLAEMDEPFQEETSTMHNQRLDGHTLANSVMMKGRKGIGIKEDEPIFPGRWFLVDEMDDIEPMSMGRNFDSSIQDEQMTMSYATKRTGVNDYVMGNSANASIGYAAAYTNVMQHQEAAKRFDQTLREIRQAVSDSGRRLVELYQQFNQEGKVFSVMGQQDGQLVNQVLQFPLELIRHSIAIDVTASSASLNKDVTIRTNTIIMQMVTQFYMQLMQGIQLIINPQVPELMRAVALQMVMGGTTLMRRLLDSYNVQDIDEIVPRMEEFLGGQQQPTQPTFGMAGPSAFGGGSGGPPANVPFGGMAGLPPGPPQQTFS
jgi:hypothetical protein